MDIPERDVRSDPISFFLGGPDMWMECDTLYFRRRARQEREAATAAPHPDARNAHLTMALRFEELAGAIEQNEQRWSTQYSRGPAELVIH